NCGDALSGRANEQVPLRYQCRVRIAKAAPAWGSGRLAQQSRGGPIVSFGRDDGRITSRHCADPPPRSIEGEGHRVLGGSAGSFVSDTANGYTVLSRVGPYHGAKTR